MKDDSCEGHKEKGELCYIRIKNKPIKKGEVEESLIFEAVADYDKDGNLVGIEFWEGIPKKLEGDKR